MIFTGTTPMMSTEEIAFLERDITRRQRWFEYGSGGSSLFLAMRVASVITVEHSRMHAIAAVNSAPPNLTVIYAPPEPGVGFSDADGDGTLQQFKTYVDTFTGHDVDCVLIDGRARRWCARRILETAPFGPDPDLKIYMHDADREEVSCIWTGGEFAIDLVERVGNLALLRPRP